MTATATGRVVRGAEGLTLRYERRLEAPVADVWAAVTESERLGRWIGTWTGDPASGEVQLTWTAEGDGTPTSRVAIRACDPPRSLVVDALDETGAWHLGVELAPDAGGTLLTFTQLLDGAPGDASGLAEIGPGWDYYLDRLVAAQTGADPDALDWDRDYVPLGAHYARLADGAGGSDGAAGAGEAGESAG